MNQSKQAQPGQQPITWFKTKDCWMAQQSIAVVGKVWSAEDSSKGAFYWSAVGWASEYKNGERGHGYSATLEEAKQAIENICVSPAAQLPAQVAEPEHVHRWVGGGDYGGREVGQICADCGIDIGDAAPEHSQVAHPELIEVLRRHVTSSESMREAYQRVGTEKEEAYQLGVTHGLERAIEVCGNFLARQAPEHSIERTLEQECHELVELNYAQGKDYLARSIAQFIRYREEKIRREPPAATETRGCDPETIMRFRKMLDRIGIHGYYSEMQKEFGIDDEPPAAVTPTQIDALEQECLMMVKSFSPEYPKAASKRLAAFVREHVAASLAKAREDESNLAGAWERAVEKLQAGVKDSPSHDLKRMIKERVEATEICIRELRALRLTAK